MKLLFIARTYPPIVGGMEKFASDFYENYRKKGEIDLLANADGKKMIPFFFIKVVFFLAFHSRNYDVIHLGDAVLSPLIVVIRLFSHARVSFTVHGLDVVYSRFGYQKIILPFLRRADRIFAVSQFTLEQCELRRVSSKKLMVIPNCINFEYVNTFSKSDISKVISRFNIDVKEKKILLTVGRLIKRKGHAWFLTNVFKNLPEHYIYIIAGSGPEYEAIKQVVQDFGLAYRVYLLGRVSDEEKNCLYQISDLFVMPNIRVENDQEGFGIVVLEAGRYGLPVIASNIEGIRDAVINRKTGHLIEEKDAQGFMDAIIKPDIDRSSLADTVASYFDWKHITERYYEEFEKMKAG